MSGFTEEIADTNQHFPIRPEQIDERQPLRDLHVEAAVESRPIVGAVVSDVAAVHLEDKEHARRGAGHDGFDRRGEVVNMFASFTQRRRETGGDAARSLARPFGAPIRRRERIVHRAAHNAGDVVRHRQSPTTNGYISGAGKTK